MKQDQGSIAGPIKVGKLDLNNPKAPNRQGIFLEVHQHSLTVGPRP